MRLRRGAGWDRHGEQPVAAAGWLGASAVVAVSREYRALGRVLRPGPGIKRRSVWGRLVGWVFRHLPEIVVVLLLIRVVYPGRRRYCAVPLLALVAVSEDFRRSGPFVDEPGVQL